MQLNASAGLIVSSGARDFSSALQSVASSQAATIRIQDCPRYPRLHSRLHLGHPHPPSLQEDMQGPVFVSTISDVMTSAVASASASSLVEATSTAVVTTSAAHSSSTKASESSAHHSSSTHKASSTSSSVKEHATSGSSAPSPVR
ncbi:hypothetical protein L226DRAFT_566116 [Lentinus tigrinus ALCF2SS1-7]|uniref:Uncharacterized protein n=1 Tax=Lentinus tigrinus ALCF2SS1-6 TaxID=1328759 RepID=A0A5C2SUT2_9APHY|nr:hypothetical protein L227DRAFT_605779 [Lentinus tigrinus ALCF2SS1-6]RPD81332.1 hypothetical protein L226DRAFT_566116 [Lentinus tigrinus ALCF2SS1-7]